MVPDLRPRRQRGHRRHVLTGAAPGRHRAEALLALGATLLVFFAFCVGNGANAWRDFPMDDAWIHQAYVAGLLRDGVPTYNPGIPEAGFSSLLWIVALAPVTAALGAVGVGQVLAAKLLGAAFALVTALGVTRLTRRLEPGGIAAPVAGLLVLLGPAFAFAAVSGMEVTITAAALVWALDAVAARRLPRAGLLLGLAGLARPEAAVAVAALALAGLCAAPTGRQRLRSLAWSIGPAALLGAAWVLYGLSVSGHPLPNTFYVKSGGASLDHLAQLGIYWRSVVLSSGPAWAVATAALYVLGARRALASVRTRPLATRILVVQAASVAAILATRTLGALATFGTHRYFLPFTVLDAVFVALGLVELGALLRRVLPARARRGAVVLALLALAPLPGALLAQRERYAGHCDDVYTLHTEPALAIAATAPPDAVVAVEGAGAARALGDRWTLDLLGLNHAGIAHATGDDWLRTCLIVGHRPTVFAVPVEWLPTLDRIFELREERRFVRERWVSVGGGESRTVVLATGSARPAILSACAARYAAEGGDGPSSLNTRLRRARRTSG